jgi:hypothetical protein
LIALGVILIFRIAAYLQRSLSRISRKAVAGGNHWYSGHFLEANPQKFPEGQTLRHATVRNLPPGVAFLH